MDKGYYRDDGKRDRKNSEPLTKAILSFLKRNITKREDNNINIEKIISPFIAPTGFK